MSTAPLSANAQFVAKPWYLSLALGASAWFAGILMLIGFALLFDFDSVAKLTGLGIVLIGAAFMLMFFAKESDFATQLGLCFSVAGQCMVVFGLNENFDSPSRLAFNALILQLVLACLMPNRMHRSFSAFFAVIAWAFWLRFMPQGGDNFDLLWGSRFNAALLLPTGQALMWWAMTWVPVIVLCWVLLQQRATQIWLDVVYPILRGLLIGLACASVISNFGSLFGMLEQSGVAIWCIASAAAAYLALIFSFILQNKPLMGFSIACVFAHLVHFYYALGTTLVDKSVLMLVVGVVCLSLQQLLKNNAFTSFGTSSRSNS